MSRPKASPSSSTHPRRYPWSRALSAASAGYGVWCLVRPDQLASALDQQPSAGWRRLSYAYGLRDLAISAAAFGPDGRWVRASITARLLGDITDCVTLGARLRNEPGPRRKAMLVTGAWATLNAVALWRDSRRR